MAATRNPGCSLALRDKTFAMLTQADESVVRVQVVRRGFNTSLVRKFLRTNGKVEQVPSSQLSNFHDYHGNPLQLPPAKKRSKNVRSTTVEVAPTVVPVVEVVSAPDHQVETQATPVGLPVETVTVSTESVESEKSELVSTVH